MQMQKFGNAKKVEMKNISSDMQITNKLNSATQQKSATTAEIKNLNEIISKSNLSSQSDLATLLSQLTLKPVKDQKSGKSLFQVTKIEAGSIWEKSGLKVGDLVTQQ